MVVSYQTHDRGSIQRLTAVFICMNRRFEEGQELRPLRRIVMPQEILDQSSNHITPGFDFGDFPVLTTERLCLCEYSAEYLEDIFAIRSDPVVQLYNSRPHQTRADTLMFIEEERENYRLKKEVIWAVQQRASGRVIGSVSVFAWNRYDRHAGMGCHLEKDCWGMESG